jgi:hypothetical protein
MLLKIIHSVFTVVIFTYKCVFGFSILVSLGSQQCSLVWYALKHGVSHNPMLHSRYLYFVLLSLCLAEHTWHQILLHCMSHCLLCLESSLVSWLVDGACLLCLSVWGQGTLLVSCIRSLANVSLNFWSYNFEPQEARMIKLLRMVRSRRWKNSFIVHCQFHLLKECLSYSQIRPYILCVYYSLVLWPVSQLFHAHHRNYLPMVENACSSVCWYFICPSLLLLSRYLSP